MDSMNAVMQQQMLMNSAPSASDDNNSIGGMNTNIAKMDDTTFLVSLQRAKESGNGLMMDSMRPFSLIPPLEQGMMLANMHNNNMLGNNNANNAALSGRPAAGNGRAWAA